MYYTISDLLHYRSFVVVNNLWLAPEWLNGPLTCLI